MKKKLLLFSMLLVFGKTEAQFQYAYGKNSQETGQSVQLTLDSGYIIAGQTKYPYIGKGDATLLRTDKHGTPQWIKAYGGDQVDFFNSVRQVHLSAELSGYVATGHTSSFGFGNNDVYLVGTTSTGVPVFSKTFGGQGSDIGYCIQNIRHLQDGPGYVIVGETNSFTFFPGTNIYVIRTDIFGNLKQSAVIGSKGDDQGFWIEQTRDGGYIIAGTTTYQCSASGTTVVNREIFAIRLKPDLTIAWNRILGGINVNKDDIAYCVRENEDGSFIFTGLTRSFGGNGDAFLLNLDAAGNLLWMKTYGNKLLDQGMCVLNSTYGVKGYAVSGFTNAGTATTVREDALLFHTDNAGNLVWTKRYGLQGKDFGYELTRSQGPGFAFTGRENSFGAGYYDVYLVETDLNGNSHSGCETTIDQRELKVSPCVTESAQLVYVEPEMRVESKYLDIKYKQARCYTSDVEEDAKLAMAPEGTDNSLSQGISVVPNPASTMIKLSFSESYIGGVIKIFDYQGRMVMEKQAAQNDISMGIERLPGGLYFIRISGSSGEAETIRFIKQ